jgi:hypothetical protein
MVVHLNRDIPPVRGSLSKQAQLAIDLLCPEVLAASDFRFCDVFNCNVWVALLKRVQSHGNLNVEVHLLGGPSVCAAK